MKHLLFKTIAIVTICLVVSGTQAQVSIKEAINYLPKSTFPYNPGKGTENYKRKHVAIRIPENKIQVKLYNNFQLTDYVMARMDDITAPSMCARFDIPDQSYILTAIIYGGVSGRTTEMLVVMDKELNIISTLEARIFFDPAIPAKQYRIMADGSIVVTILKPTTTESIPFNNFTSFTANRVDYTYQIVDGKFELKETEIYPVANYTESQLSNKTYNLWD